MKRLIAGAILMSLLLLGCGARATNTIPREYVINIDSEVPVVVTVTTNKCEGNWNFCKWQN
jgi:hypothetical protein